MKGYEEAQKFEESITKLMKKYPIDDKTAKGWLQFSRTLKTTCQLIEESIIKDMLDGKLVRIEQGG